VVRSRRAAGAAGNADQVEAALRGAQELAEQEQDPVAWFAFRQDATTFGVFDTFDDEQARQGHLQGPITAASGKSRRPCSARLRSSPRWTRWESRSPDRFGLRLPTAGSLVQRQYGLQNTNQDITTVFGASSLQSAQLAADPDSFKDPEVAESSTSQRSHLRRWLAHGGVPPAQPWSARTPERKLRAR
jgi:quinol monooxygenase YgiN